MTLVPKMTAKEAHMNILQIFKIKFIGVMFVNRIVQVLSVHFYDTWYVHCIVDFLEIVLEKFLKLELIHIGLKCLVFSLLETTVKPTLLERSSCTLGIRKKS